MPIPHLAAGPDNPQPQPGSPLARPGPGKATGLGTQRTSECSKLALYPPPPLPFTAGAVDPLSPRARRLFPQTKWRERREAVPWLGQLSSSSQLIGPRSGSSCPPPPQGTLSMVWRHFSCLMGGLLLASGVEGRGAAPGPKTHRRPISEKSPPEGRCKGESLPSEGTFPSTLGLGGGVWLAGFGLEGPDQGCQPPPSPSLHWALCRILTRAASPWSPVSQIPSGESPWGWPMLNSNPHWSCLIRKK